VKTESTEAGPTAEELVERLDALETAFGLLVRLLPAWDFQPIEDGFASLPATLEELRTTAYAAVAQPFGSPIGSPAGDSSDGEPLQLCVQVAETVSKVRDTVRQVREHVGDDGYVGCIPVERGGAGRDRASLVLDGHDVGHAPQSDTSEHRGLGGN
jgi:hypothetical protein